MQIAAPFPLPYAINYCATLSAWPFFSQLPADSSLYFSNSQICLFFLKYRHTAIPRKAIKKKKNAAPEPLPVPNITDRILS